MESNIYEMQQHVQRIEDLSNQLLNAQQKQDVEAVGSIIKQLDQENKLLQEQKKQFQQHLQVSERNN